MNNMGIGSFQELCLAMPCRGWFRQIPHGASRVIHVDPHRAFTAEILGERNARLVQLDLAQVQPSGDASHLVHKKGATYLFGERCEMVKNEPYYCPALYSLYTRSSRA